MNFSSWAQRSYVSTDLSQKVIIFLSLEESGEEHGGQLSLRTPPVIQGGQGHPLGIPPSGWGCETEDLLQLLVILVPRNVS